MSLNAIKNLRMLKSFTLTSSHISWECTPNEHMPITQIYWKHKFVFFCPQWARLWVMWELSGSTPMQFMMPNYNHQTVAHIYIGCELYMTESKKLAGQLTMLSRATTAKWMGSTYSYIKTYICLRTYSQMVFTVSEYLSFLTHISLPLSLLPSL